MIVGYALLALASADVTPPSNALIDAVESCRAIPDNAARLACFDRTTSAIADARARRELLITDRAQVRKARRSLFGFTIPSFKLFGGSDADDEAEEAIKQVDGKVAAVAAVGFRQMSLTLEDGTTWQTIEFARSFQPRIGDSITIKRTAFGYTAKSGYGQTGVRRVK